MIAKSFIVLLAAVALACGLFIVSAQEPDDDVRGAFLSSRPKTTNANAQSRRHSRNTNSGATSSGANKNANVVVVGPTQQSGYTVKGPTQPIGLGYTLFMRDANGRSVRAEPTREFHNGDRVRISLEPNVDGYLYVFHTEGEGVPEMIFPDPRLDAGYNAIEAHVPMEVPSSEETDERLRWFTFYGNAGTERLFIVVTRKPFPLIPTGDDLVRFCAANKDQCPWHPSAEIWARVQASGKSEVKVVTSKTFGQTQTDKEKIATTRGLGLDKTAPQPAVIRMNASTNSAVLVTVLDLVHR